MTQRIDAAIVILALAVGGYASPVAAADPDTAPMNDRVVHQVPKLPPLQLSGPQRDRVRQALGKQDTEIDLNAKAVKPAASFEPAVGAKLPSQLKAHPLPQPLISEIPMLGHYQYLKFKHRVVIVDPLTHLIADVFPEG